MEKTLAIFNRDRLYTERLGAFLRRQRELPFQIHTFTDTEELRRFSRKKAIDLLLYGEECEAELGGISVSERVSLTESSGYTDKSRFIYKYQSGELIARELASHYGDIKEEGGSRIFMRDASVYMIFSPIGRSGKTAFAMELADALSENMRVLFVSMEEYGGGEKLSYGGSEGLSEAIYYFKENELDEDRLKALCESRGGLDILPGLRSPDDISMLSSQELGRFIACLSRCSVWDAVVLDTDSVISRFYESFSLCRRVFIPIKEDSGSLEKLQSFHHFLDGMGMLSADNRFIKLLLPDTEVQKSGSGLREFTDAVIRRYIL